MSISFIDSRQSHYITVNFLLDFLNLFLYILNVSIGTFLQLL
jgi:hypothetical protein